MLKIKMFRDIKNNPSQFITIFLMVMIGLLAYTGIEAYMSGMQESGDKFYQEYNLQDMNVVGSFTKEDVETIKNIPGIKDANGKLEVTATSGDNTILLSLIDENTVSKFYVVEGNSFSNTDGIWLDNFYAKENNIKVGDTVSLKYNNITLNPKVIGLINVPDHVYDVKDESELFPNKKEFGFAYMSSSQIENLNIFSSVMVKLDKNASYDEVKYSLEKNKSVLGVVDIKNTRSYKTYQGEIDEGKSYVGIFSGLFLFIAILSVITTMTRIIKKQRTEIGILKSLGYTDARIMFHYTSYGFAISLVGCIFGILIGFFGIGNMFINMEMTYFEVPNAAPILNSSVYLVTILVVLAVSLVTTLSCMSILKENPSETLKPPVPKVKKSSLNITTKGIFKRVSFSSKWNLRDILRNKARTIMGIVGVTTSCCLIVCAIGMLNSMNYFIKLQFKDLYNFDYKLNLNSNITDSTYNDLTEKYGDATSESLGIEMLLNDKFETNNLFVTDAKNYVRFVNEKDEFITINNNDGVYITRKLASINNLKVGDTIKWKIYGSEKVLESKIVGLNKDPQNQNVTITKDYLTSLGFTYKPDSLYTNKDLSKTSTLPGVELIQSVSKLESGMNNMLNTMKTMIVLIIFIAAVLGSVIIYNMGVLSLTEKTYQFATLKVLGFSDKLVKKIFKKQNNWILIISLIIGLPLGYYLADYLFTNAIEEHYDFKAHIEVLTYIISAFATFVISSVTVMILSKKITKLDMVSSLKSNE